MKRTWVSWLVRIGFGVIAIFVLLRSGRRAYQTDGRQIREVAALWWRRADDEANLGLLVGSHWLRRYRHLRPTPIWKACIPNRRAANTRSSGAVVAQGRR